MDPTPIQNQEKVSVRQYLRPQNFGVLSALQPAGLVKGRKVHSVFVYQFDIVDDEGNPIKQNHRLLGIRICED